MYTNNIIKCMPIYCWDTA